MKRSASPRERMGSKLRSLMIRTGRAHGFTLIEILVSLVIFALAVLGIAVGATSVMRGNQVALYSTIATDLAQDKLEDLKAQTPTTISSGGPVTNTLNGVTFSRTWTVTPNSPVAGVRRIDVTVTWSDYQSRTLTISSAVKE
jgi:type IV pilus assembly protein PilV